MGKQLGKNFKFHNNIDTSNDTFSKFLSFDQEIFIKWIKKFMFKDIQTFDLRVIFNKYKKYF